MITSLSEIPKEILENYSPILLCKTYKCIQCKDVYVAYSPIDNNLCRICKFEAQQKGD